MTQKKTPNRKSKLRNLPGNIATVVLFLGLVALCIPVYIFEKIKEIF